MTEPIMFGHLSRAGATLILVVCIFAAAVVSFVFSKAGISQSYLPDHPNERSSHSVVTPRSGGLAIMAGWIISILMVTSFVGSGAIASDIFKFLFLGLMAATTGYLDDKFSLPASQKLGLQVVTATGFVFLFGGIAFVPVPLIGFEGGGILIDILTVFWIVAFMNIFNFMDGANGIAGIAAIIATCAVAAAAAAYGAPLEAAIAIMLAFSIVGFIPNNFPHGRIFMGDSGSHSISFVLAALAIIVANKSNGQVSALFIPTLMMPFIFDVGFTLAHRIMRKQNVMTAHREHLYQLLLRQGNSHERVASFYASLVTMSVAVAIAMLAMRPGLQWMAPVGLAALFLLPAISLFRDCWSEGFFENQHVEQTEEVFDEDGDLFST